MLSAAHCTPPLPPPLRPPLEFTCIDGPLAERLLAECGHAVAPADPPARVTPAQSMALHLLLGQAKFDPPAADCLSPAGEYNLRLGVMKELRPDMVATYCGAGGTPGGRRTVFGSVTPPADVAAGAQGRRARTAGTPSWWRRRWRWAAATSSRYSPAASARAAATGPRSARVSPSSP